MSAVAQPSEVQVVRQQIDGMAGQFQSALPAHIPVERFARVVMTAIQNNGELMNCNRRSLFNAAMKAAQDGLLPDGREGAMVPYKGEVQWMPMVGGIRKKVRNSGEIATWDVQAVYEKDAFEFELGDEPFIKHKPALSERGKLVAVYSIATLKSGEKSRDVMSVEDVEKIRAKSRSAKGPWSDPTFYPEMAKKTVARRHSKVLPMSSDLDDLIRRDDALYDMAGAGDAAVQKRPRDLASRLDALAPGETADQVTGEITDAGGDDNGRVSSEEMSNARETAEDVSDPIADARAAGTEAKRKGMTKRSMPARYREEGAEDLAQAFNEGFDAAA